MMKKLSTIAGIMSLIIFFGVLVSVTDTASAQGYRGLHEGKGFWADLTEEQRDAVRDKKEEMRSEGATREEIHKAIAKMLEGYGIEVPELRRGPIGLGRGRYGFGDKLSDEQRKAVQQKRQQMREQGATRQEIHAAVGEMLKGYGVELPESWDEGHRGGHWRWLNGLTKEQREAVRDKIEQMRDQGATRQEIRAALGEMLKGYGIEVPEGRQGPLGFGHKRFGLGVDMTEEQQEAVRGKIKELRGQGATREQIHTEVAAMLKSFGIQVPENWRGPLGLGHRRFGLGADLTEEQQEAVHGKIKELRGQGATREQIHTEVTGMLKNFGIQVPQDWRGPLGLGHKRFGFRSNLSDEQREALRERIKEMRHQGDSREDIHAAIAEMIKGFGAEQPENPESTPSKTETAQSHITAQSYPNPFNPEADIAYRLGLSENVRIQIYNVSGQLIRTFDMGRQPAGSYTVRWDGRNENGDIAASGVYLYRIEAGPYEVTNRMVLLK